MIQRAYIKIFVILASSYTVVFVLFLIHSIILIYFANIFLIVFLCEILT